MMLWGFKTEAAFDVWSAEHLMMGISLACAVQIIIKALSRNEAISETLKTKITFMLVLLIALLWETVEHYIELGLLGDRIAYWFYGQEHWSNRLIADNIMVMLGWFIYTKNNKMVWFARVFSCIWLFFHIIIFPHSMYLHELMSKR